MTESEAIEYAKRYLDTKCYTDKCVNAHSMAIEALEDVQQYRAIGTVEELKQVKKYVKLAKKHGTIGQVIDACAEYEEIGTVEECRAAVEKQIPKKVKNSGERIPFEWYCPACGEVLCDDGYKDTDIKFCCVCGQSLKWDDENEREKRKVMLFMRT